MKEFGVYLENIVKNFQLKTIYLPKNKGKILIFKEEFDMAGNYIFGFSKISSEKKFLVFGELEIEILNKMSSEKREKLFLRFCEKKPTAIIFTGFYNVFLELKKACEKNFVPLFETNEKGSFFYLKLMVYLNERLGPFFGIHGGLVEVFGEGVLILGESFVGKSETAIELVKKGHIFVADDVVKIRRDFNKTLVGYPKSNIKNLIEIKGIGIINIKDFFGVKSVKEKTTIKLAIKLKKEKLNKTSAYYFRKGYFKFLDVFITKYEISSYNFSNVSSLIELIVIKNKQENFNKYL